MKNSVIPVLAIAAVLFLLTSAGHAASVPQPGTSAPNFTLPSQDGSKISLDQFRGQWVVLYFYPRDMTSGCTIEAHNFQRDLAQYSAKKAAIVGISADTIDSHTEFCTKESLTFKLLADPEKKMIAAYGSLAGNGMVASRNTFLIDSKGVIRKVYTGVKPNVHSEEVLTALGELQH